MGSCGLARWLVGVTTLSLALSAPGCGGDDGGSGGAVRVWAAQSTGLRQLWDQELAPALDRDAELVEPDLTFDEIEPELRTAIADETLDADLVMVPEAMGRRLLADGLLEEPYVVLFSSEDPDEAAELFGVLVAPPAGRGAGTGGLTAPSGPVVEYEHGCLTAESRDRLRTGSTAGEPVGAGRRALDGDVEPIEGTIEAAAKGLVDGVVDNIRMGRIVSSLELLATDYGSAAAVRLVGRANVVISTAMTAKALLELGDAVADERDARSDAVIAATETYYDAISAISGARSDLYAIREGLRSCDLSGDDARAQIDDLNRTVQRHAQAARDAMSDIVRLRGEDTTLRPEALDNEVSRFLELSNQIGREADAKSMSMMPDDLTSVGETAMELVDAPTSGDPDWRAFTMLLTGLDPDNPFTHSNGELMTTAAGETDMIFIGGFWFDVSDLAASYLFSDTGRFPCGMGPVARTYCGMLPFSGGRALLLAAVMADVIPDSAPGQYYQYGFPLDADGDSTNNYMASASYPNDLFDATDWWLELDHDGAADSWSVGSTLARGGSTSPRATGTRIIVNGNSIVAVIPESELESTMPTFRGTAFRHTGDYGLNPPHDFNGDIYPAVGMPLLMPDPTVFVGREGG